VEGRTTYNKNGVALTPTSIDACEFYCKILEKFFSKWGLKPRLLHHDDAKISEKYVIIS
jgi:hypothetical protein